MKNGIIFDMDGTLWDTTKQVVPAWNIVLKRHNLNLITIEDMQKYMGKTIEMIAKIMLPELPLEKSLSILCECCAEEQSYLTANGGVLYKNVEDTLKILKEKYNLYIVSNCHTKYMEAFFAYHKLEKYFDDCECHGRTGFSKGENIRLIIQRNSLDKAVYVGDTQSDLDAADFANVPFIYARYGFGTVNRDVRYISEFRDILKSADKIL